MRLDCLDVGGGFLDGVRLNFSDGLNVLIGPRGAGKTSVLELARFAIGVPAMTPEANRAAVDQARAVLGDGTVTLYCSVEGQQLVFRRTTLDDAPSGSQPFPYAPPLIVSQSEIEAIGLDPHGRRDILDRLIDPIAWSEIDASDSRASIATLQRRIERLREERERFVENVGQIAGLAAELSAAEREQATVSKAVSEAKPLQEAIAREADELGQTRAAADAYKLAEEALKAWKKDLSESALAGPLPQLPSAAVNAQVTAVIEKVSQHVEDAVSELDAALKITAKERSSARRRQGTMQDKLKADAERLEALQRGAGDVGRRVSALRQQLKEREGDAKRAKQLEAEIGKLTKERDAALDEEERRLDRRYELRARRAAELTKEFGARIEVRVDKSGEFSAYEATLVELLQGSNLQYRPLAAALAAKVSPRELVAAVESNDVEGIAKAAQITDERASRLLGHLEQQSLADVLLAPLDDSVDFALLDGKGYKSTRHLSMGQRCTVVLPLLLAESRESIILDQPEDHLDNAFIVETLVHAIRERAVNGQIIVATHNANIPVLGDAAQVVVLASDGRRGFVEQAAALDDQGSVDAITTLMEGGRDAFARRAAFYSAHER
jgi:hypothetical protein